MLHTRSARRLQRAASGIANSPPTALTYAILRVVKLAYLLRTLASVPLLNPFRVVQ